MLKYEPAGARKQVLQKIHARSKEFDDVIVNVEFVGTDGTPSGGQGQEKKPKKRWNAAALQHVLDIIRTAEQIQPRDLSPSQTVPY